MLFLRKRQKIYIKTKFPGWGVLFSRYCIQLQIEWYQPPIGIFLVCGEITKIISKMFEKTGKFHVILEKTSKNVLKQNSQVGGFFFPRTAFNYKSNGINPPSVSFLCVEKFPK